MIKKIGFILLIFTIAISCKDSERKEATPSEEEEKTTTYYLIRHAEKDRNDPENSDPMLTDTGKEHAQLWAHYFDTITLNAVYSTKYVRTIMTATPTAESKRLDVLPYDPQNLYDADFVQATNNKKVLVVGHSNTTPAFVNKIIGIKRYHDMADNDNSTLFVIKVYNNMSVVNVRTVSL